MSMEYSNPEIPEGINTSKEHPLKEFFILLFGLGALFALTLIVLSLIAEYLVEYIPFSAEEKMASLYEDSVPKQELDDPAAIKIQNYLQKLADRLSVAQNLPADITIKVHYVNDDMVNAFATLGGHIIMFRGLLEKVPNENTLAMVMAHEIAHIKHRHPIKALGRAVVVGVTVGIMSTSMGDSLSSEILGEAGLLTSLKFSRDQEIQSDNTAIHTLVDNYGHGTGADALFSILKQESGEDKVAIPEFLSTHPLSQQRIQNVQAKAIEGDWSLQAQITLLPSEFNDWLTTSKNTLTDQASLAK